MSETVTFFGFVTRKKGTTREEFSKYWKEKHGPLVAEWLAKRGAINYRQFHIAEGQDVPPGLDYDGVVQLEAPPGFWTEAAEDPFYKNVIVPDEAAFFERSNFVVISGNNNCVVEGGKPTENAKKVS